MSEQRDTKFAGFAKLLWDELLNVRERGYIDVSDGWLDQEFNDEYRQIIAQRAYDLVEHTIDFTIGQGVEYTPPDASYVPDLTAWPEQEEK